MSIKEGELLRLAIRQSNKTVDDIAKLMGYSGRTALTYQFSKDRLDPDLKEKAAKALNITENQIFGQNNHTNEQIFDTEKEALRDLVEAQKEIIKYQRELLIAQSVRNEALATVILARLAEVEVAVDPSKKKIGFDNVLSEAQKDVQETLKRIKARLGLPD